MTSIPEQLRELAAELLTIANKIDAHPAGYLFNPAEINRMIRDNLDPSTPPGFGSDS